MTQPPRDLLVAVKTARADSASAIVRLQDLEGVERFRQNHRARVRCDRFVRGDVSGHRLASGDHPHWLWVMIYGNQQPPECYQGHIELMERQLRDLLDSLPPDSLVRKAIDDGRAGGEWR